MLFHRSLRKIASVRETGGRRLAREPLSKMLLFEFDMLNDFVGGIVVELEPKGLTQFYSSSRVQ
jgi:hypothetical protein